MFSKAFKIIINTSLFLRFKIKWLENPSSCFAIDGNFLLLATPKNSKKIYMKKIIEKLPII